MAIAQMTIAQRDTLLGDPGVAQEFKRQLRGLVAYGDAIVLGGTRVELAPEPDEPVPMLCGLVSDAPRRSPASTQEPCTNCHRPVWVSGPDRPARTVPFCSPCVHGLDAQEMDRLLAAH